MFYNWWASFIVKYYVVIKRELDVWTEVHPKLGNRRVSQYFGHVTKHPTYTLKHLHVYISMDVVLKYVYLMMQQLSADVFEFLTF